MVHRGFNVPLNKMVLSPVMISKSKAEFLIQSLRIQGAKECSSSNTGVMRSYLRVPVNKRVAEFCTYWSLLI